MKFNRVEAGHYRSEDGRVEICKESYDSFNGRKHVRETVWHITIDGKTLACAELTKRDALEVAEHKLKES